MTGLHFLPLVSANIRCGGLCDKPKEHLILHGKLVSIFSQLNLEMKMLEGFISPGTKKTVKNNEVTVVGVR